MKYRCFITWLVFLAAAGFSDPVSAQGKSSVSWRDAATGPISKLIISFGKSADLNYTEEDTLDFGLNEKRENLGGIDMFKKSLVLPKEAADSSLYRMNKIINFIDTAYIRLYNNIADCRDDRTRDSLIQEFTSNSRVYRYISIDEYIQKMKRIYDRSDISDMVLPGSASGVETSLMTDQEKMKNIFIAEQRQRLTSTKWQTKVSAYFDFVGYFLDKNNEQQHIGLRNAKLVFDVSFDETKTKNGKVYSNYRIEKVIHPLRGKDTIIDKYLFTLQPFISAGARTITSKVVVPLMDQNLRIDDAGFYEAGILFERKFKPFSNKKYIDFTVATGVTFSQFEVNSSLADTYPEEADRDKAPFETSGFLKQYSIKSAFENISFHDVMIYAGIPLRVGLGFKLDANNKVRGYLNSTVTWNFPVDSRTDVKGSVDQTGKFVYEFLIDGKIQTSVVEIGKEGNPFPQFYGVNNAYAPEAAKWKGGLVSKTELGLIFGLRNNTFIKFGPYFSIGSYKLKNPPLQLLALEGGEIHSPLSAMDDRLSVNGYGISLSVLFDFMRLSGN